MEANYQSWLDNVEAELGTTRDFIVLHDIELRQMYHNNLDPLAAATCFM